MVASSRPVRAVLFDLGGTVVAEGALLTGSREAVRLLSGRLGIGTLADEVVMTWVRAVQASLGEQLTALSATNFYRFADLERVAYQRAARALDWEVDPGWFEDTWLAFWRASGTRDGWMPGAAETLRRLRAAGLSVGIVSNIDEAPLQAMTAGFVADDLVDFALSSEAAGSCKPDAGIFEVGLGRAGVGPEEAVYVGDSVPFDVVGANRAGMRSVLLTQGALSVAVLHELGEAGTPDHTIAHLDELLGVVGVGSG